MSKIEKTLELNITHEILSLADSFWWYLQPMSLKRYWRPYWRFPLMQTPNCYATGLPINLEGRDGGGYDVCLKSPPNFNKGNPRLLFMQFKAGEEKLFNSNPESLFYGDITSPCLHVEFQLNNNHKRNQHELLRDLAVKAGNRDAVTYVFPRIVNEEQLTANIGKLLSKTSFISISDIDIKAEIKGITLNDGNIHRFRTCYTDYKKNEINFFYFQYIGPDKPGGIIGEIFCIRMYRALQALKAVQSDNFYISKIHILDAMIRHVLNIAASFSIHLNIIVETFDTYFSIRERLKANQELFELSRTYPKFDSEYNANIKTFKDIVESISLYFKWIETIGYFGKNTYIYSPPSKYTIEIPTTGIHFSIDENNYKYAPEDYEGIMYSLF